MGALRQVGEEGIPYGPSTMPLSFRSMNVLCVETGRLCEVVA